MAPPSGGRDERDRTGDVATERGVARRALAPRRRGAVNNDDVTAILDPRVRIGMGEQEHRDLDGVGQPARDCAAPAEGCGESVLLELTGQQTV
jgi:hypothetical protein